VKLLRTIDEMGAASRAARHDQRRLGFVPTMGALHGGHLSLVRLAKSRCDCVAASIFVNPTQFGPNEDFTQYPRSFERDCELLQAEGVDLLFAPSVEEMYPRDAHTWVYVEEMSERLCGQFRPGHFRGVTTVVSKLIHIVKPDLAFFGQKDAAQVAIIRRMVRDLAFDVEIVVGATIRESDGVAMSSRNAYLSAAERKQAPVLYRALMRVQTLADSGERNAEKLIAAARDVLAEEPAVQVEYVEAVNNDTLEPIADVSSGALVALAARLGGTRLIDNIVLTGVGTAFNPAK
jgi:pantoate--beta-alanine ligase